MVISPSPENAKFFAALASDVRLKVIQMLTVEELNIKELADRIGISSPIMLKHVQKLEDVGFVSTRLVKRNGSISKVCTLVFAEYRFMIETRRNGLPLCRSYSVPVGHYYDIVAVPTCGLAAEKGPIGFMDDPAAFWDVNRVNAQLLWLTQGLVEYRVPNHVTSEQNLIEIEASFEIASEAPDFADDWPSDITFYLNNVKLFTWTSLGDYGVKRGVLTPEWWQSNQYGMLKTLRVTRDGSYIDDKKASDVTIQDVTREVLSYWSIRFEVPADAKNPGGLTLFGQKFGNHAQDIVIRVFYEKK